MANHYKVWENYHKFADHRGKLVTRIVSQFLYIEGKDVLDVGCGEGGTVRAFHQSGAKVLAIDIRPDIHKIFRNEDFTFRTGSIETTDFAGQQFDVIILQDVFEHLNEHTLVVQKIKTLLKKEGVVYLSTPNRFSLLNIISDPHWNLPFIALLPRQVVKFLVHDILRRDRRQRQDWPALFSLATLKKIFDQNGLKLSFVNSIAAQALFETPEAVICHPTHLKIVDKIKSLHWDKQIIRLVNDKFGIFNNLINPTWYMIGQHK